ncbi:unnamed protein product, partial [Closterium sp. NIES-54]
MTHTYTDDDISPSRVLNRVCKSEPRITVQPPSVLMMHSRILQQQQQQQQLPLPEEDSEPRYYQSPDSLPDGMSSVRSMMNPGIDGSGRSGGGGGSGQRSPAIPRSSRSVGGIGIAAFGGGKGGRSSGAVGMTSGVLGSSGGAAGSDEARLYDPYGGADAAFGNEWEAAEPGKASRRAASDGEASGFVSKPSSLIR